MFARCDSDISISSKPILDLALTAAVLSLPISIDLEYLSAIFARDFVIGFLLDLVEMLVPPLIAAFVAAEFFLLSLCNLFNGFSAI